jgi:hypothetical protein
MNFKLRFFSTLACFSLLVACGGGADGDDNADDDMSELNEIPEHVLEESEALKTNIDGKIFSIPSPVQMTTLLKSENDMFNEDLLTDPASYEKYTTENEKALIMGVFGADLGYATIYDNNSKALSYFNSLDALSNDLALNGAFDANLLERFIQNGNNKDSMLVIMSEGYRGGDKFLKENEQHNIAALIITGGWVEALHFASEVYQSTKSQAIANRIGEQATSLSTLIDLISEYNKEGAQNDLISKLQDLKSEFDKIEYQYMYKEPKQHPENSLTHITSTSTVVVNDKILKNVNTKISQLRNYIIG